MVQVSAQPSAAEQGGPDMPAGGGPQPQERPRTEGEQAGMPTAQLFLLTITGLGIGFAALIALVMYWLAPALNS
jgi:hypothetical protein